MQVDIVPFESGHPAPDRNIGDGLIRRQRIVCFAGVNPGPGTGVACPCGIVFHCRRTCLGYISGSGETARESDRNFPSAT